MATHPTTLPDRTATGRTLPSTSPDPGRLGVPAGGPVERAAIAIVAIAALAFGAWGVQRGAPSTLSYLAVVGLIGLGLGRLARGRLSAPVVMGLAVLAVGHLAGGMVAVGGDVLYNADAGSPLLRYDHLVHASGVALAVLVLGTLLGPIRGGTATVPVPVVCVLGGLGAGAVNETIEFLTTLAHDGTHVGGYVNTGWDLVSNVLGATVAGLVLARRPGPTTAADQG